VTYALLADGADGDFLDALDRLLAAPADSPTVTPPAPPRPPPAFPAPPRGWDPATWGTTPEAQSELARAMAMFGSAG
jgi:hypothetical protein